MIKVEYIKNFNEDNEEIISSKIFPKALSRWDKDVENYTYETLLDLNITYDLVNYELLKDAIDEVIYENDKIVSINDCVEKYFNL